jgi:hypothetical protein
LAAKVAFSDLPVGSRFILDGELCLKLERELRAGMLHCTNAGTAGGGYVLCDEDQLVEPLPSLPA